MATSLKQATRSLFFAVWFFGRGGNPVFADGSEPPDDMGRRRQAPANMLKMTVQENPKDVALVFLNDGRLAFSLLLDCGNAGFAHLGLRAGRRFDGRQKKTPPGAIRAASVP